MDVVCLMGGNSGQADKEKMAHPNDLEILYPGKF